MTIDLENTEWVIALKGHNSAAIRDLSDFLRRGLAKALSKRAQLGDSDIDDFVREAVIRVTNRLQQFRGDSKFAAWAMSIAVRTAFNHLRKRRVQVEVDASPEVMQAAPADDESSDPAVDSQRKELLECLKWAIDNKLTDRQKSAVEAFLTGTPQVVIAEEHGMTSGAFHKMMHDARRKLRTELELAGFNAISVSKLLGGAS